MTIIAEDTVFPDNAVALIVARIKPAVDADLTVLRRPLKPTDPTQSVGVFPLAYQPIASSQEMGNTMLGNPNIAIEQATLARYHVVIQSFVKHFDEEQGVTIHSILSARLKSMFFRDVPLGVGLTALSVSMNNSTERLQRRGITTQRYLSTEIERVFQYTSWLEVWLETETVSS